MSSNLTSPSALSTPSCCDRMCGYHLVDSSGTMSIREGKAKTKKKSPFLNFCPLPFAFCLLPCRSNRGQSTVEFALVYGFVLLPLTFIFVFACQLLWVWHS